MGHVVCKGTSESDSAKVHVHVRPKAKVGVIILGVVREVEGARWECLLGGSQKFDYAVDC